MTEPTTAAGPHTKAGSALMDAFVSDAEQDGSALRDPWIMAGDHPESSCGRCGHANVWSWSAPSPLWNAVMRDPETGADAYGVVCPPCFSELASLKGLGGKSLDGLPRWHWRFAPEIPDVAIAALWTDRDGRVWDPESWLWKDAVLAALPPSAPPAPDLSRRRGRYGRFDHEPDTADVAYECEDLDEHCVLHRKYGGVPPSAPPALDEEDPDFADDVERGRKAGRASLDVERLAAAARQVFGGKPPGWEVPPTAPYQQRADSAFRHLANDIAAEYARLAEQDREA